MIKNEEHDYLAQDADFLDHQFEVNPPLFAGLSSERDKEWQQYMATHEGKTAAQLYREGEFDEADKEYHEEVFGKDDKWYKIELN